jgi:hypothetical protein
MDYGSLLGRSWRIVWSHKFLIAVGFLAALGSAGIGRWDFSYSFSGNDWPWLYSFEFERFLDQYWPLLVGVFCGLIIIAILVWLLGLSAQAGLIHAVDRLDRGESMGFGATMSAGFRKLGRMVGINLLLFVPMVALGLAFLFVALLFLIPVSTDFAYGLDQADSTRVIGFFGAFGVCLCLLFCLWLPLLLVVAAIYPFAQRSAVIDDRGVWDSIKHGWRFLRRHLGPVTVLGLIFLLIGLAFAVGIAVVLGSVGLFLVAPWLGFGSTASADFGWRILIGIVSLVAAGLMAAVVNAVLVAFRSATVTLAYKELTSKELSGEPPAQALESPSLPSE